MIRLLSLDDMPQIDALAAESLQEGFQFATRWRDAVSAAATTPDDAHQFFLGVFDGDALVAVGGVTRDPYVDEPGLGRVRPVSVAASARRRGFGRRLLASLESRARPAYSSLRLRTVTQRAMACSISICVTAPSAGLGRAHCAASSGAISLSAPIPAGNSRP